jgi:hypothetical protein
MKALVIVVSLFANAGLAGLLALRPELAPDSIHEFVVRHVQRQPPARVSPPRTKSVAPATKTPLWNMLRSEEPATLIARLRAAGFPPGVIRAVVSSEIGARYDERIRALQEPDPNTPFWKLRPNFFMHGDKRFEEMNKLYRERSRVLRELFKDDFFATDDVSAGQRRHYGNLSRSKIDVIQRIEDDYTEMMDAIRAAMQGIVLPEDRDKLALLAREKRADLAAVLTPDELADYELRTSPTTNMLKSRLGAFEPTEAEFRALYQAQQALNGKFPGSFNSIDQETRMTAQQSYQDQLRAAFGEARYATYLRDTSSEYQQLNRIAQRQNLPRETAPQAFNVRDSVAQESARIYDDPALSPDAKRTALQQLAQTARTQILATLGPMAGPEYLKIAESWLGNVERGAAVSFGRTAPMMVTNEFGSFGFSAAPEYRRVPPAPQPGR